MKDDRCQQILADMLRAAENAISFLADTTEVRFLTDEKSQLAVTMCLHIIGECAARLDEKHQAFVKDNPALPIAEMRGMRNRIAHGYSRMNFHIVWDTVAVDLPKLVGVLRQLHFLK